jgi:hypothetical protein
VQQNVNIMNISLQPAAGSRQHRPRRQPAGHQTRRIPSAYRCSCRLCKCQCRWRHPQARRTTSLASAPTAAFSLIHVPNGQLILQPLMSTANLQLVTLGPSHRQLGVAMAGGSTAPQPQAQPQQHSTSASSTSFVVSTPTPTQFTDTNATNTQRPAAPSTKARGEMDLALASLRHLAQCSKPLTMPLPRRQSAWLARL